MKTTDFSPGDNTIDSRSVIARQEELAEELQELTDALAEAKDDLTRFLTNHDSDEEDFDETVEDLKDEITSAQSAIAIWNTYEGVELENLNDLIEQAESSPDWSYGEGLIHDDYFQEYTEQLVEDCYEMPKEFDSGNWPWRHMTMDWEAAAAELKGDYMEVDFAGETYWIRG